MSDRSGSPDYRGEPSFLLVGRNGQVGSELLPRLEMVGRVVAPDRAMLDLERPDSIGRIVESISPTVVINAAAYTGVDAAESDRARCFRINAEAPRVLAEAASRCGALLIHYSTNYVFDGSASSPYREGDPVAPLGVYGESKLLGELAVAASQSRHLVLRTSAIYGWRGTNFMRRMLELAHERDELRVVSDQIVSPTPAAAIADATVRAIDAALSGRTRELGLYHLTTTGAVSWLDFARAILARDPARARQRCRIVTPIATAEYPTAARRPLNGVLSNDKFERAFGFSLGDWQAALDRVFAHAPA
jgi:dTDP-4-dehydrorhamnose reductase